MRAVLLFCLGLFIGACLPAGVPPTSSKGLETSAYDLQEKTVALVGIDSKRPKAFCSGVWVSDTSILTAFHCVAEADFPGFLYVGREDVYAPGELHERPKIEPRLSLLYATDEDHDLALLRALGGLPSHRVARVAVDTVRAGSIVQTMGHPLGLWWSYSSGNVAAIRQREFNGHDILWTQTTAPTSPGNSGCGLWDEAGFLVGLAHGGFNRGQALNVYVHAQYLADFLRKQGDKL